MALLREAFHEPPFIRFWTAFTGMSSLSFGGMTAALAARATKSGPEIYCAPTICPPVNYKYIVPVSTTLGNLTAKYNTWTQVAHGGTDIHGDQYDALVKVSADSKNVYMQHNITAPAIRAAPIAVNTTSPINPPAGTFTTSNGITITEFANGGASATFSAGGYVWALTANPTSSNLLDWNVALSNNAGFYLSNSVTLPSSLSANFVLGVRPADACWALHRSVQFLVAAGTVIGFVAGLELASIIATGPGAITALLSAGILSVATIADFAGGLGGCG